MTEQAQNQSSAMRPSPKVVVIVHLILFVLALILIIFVAPIMGERFKDFGHRLPIPTQFGLDLSVWLRKYGFFSIPVWVFLFWADAKVYAHLYRRFGRAKALWWARGISAGFLLLMAYVVLGMWMPRANIPNRWYWRWLRWLR
jgi:type II secretory pathway component PulF